MHRGLEFSIEATQGCELENRRLCNFKSFSHNAASLCIPTITICCRSDVLTWMHCDLYEQWQSCDYVTQPPGQRQPPPPDSYNHQRLPCADDDNYLHAARRPRYAKADTVVLAQAVCIDVIPSAPFWTYLSCGWIVSRQVTQAQAATFRLKSARRRN